MIHYTHLGCSVADSFTVDPDNEQLADEYEAVAPGEIATFDENLNDETTIDQDELITDTISVGWRQQLPHYP